MNRKNSIYPEQGADGRGSEPLFPGKGSEPQFLERLAGSLFLTGEMSRIIGAALPGVLSAWAGESRLRRIIARLADKVLSRGFRPGKNRPGSPVADTCRDPQFVRQAASEAPELFNAVIAAMGEFTGSLSRMSPREQRDCLKDLAEKTDLAGIGAIISSLARSAGTTFQDPEFMVETFRPGVRALIESIDFGEIKETLDGSAESITALVGMVNEELWEYPAKMVCLLSLIPSLANIAVRSAVKTTVPLNTLPPDLLTDVILALARDIDGRSMGILANELCEIIRKIHTGSALIGDRGNHAVADAVSRLVSETLGSLDIQLFLKSRDMLRELGDVARVSVIKILETSPEIASDLFQGHFRSLVSWVRAWSLKADTFERVFTDEKIATEFARGMGELDAQDMASTLGRICEVFNRVRQLSPGTIKNFLSQFFSALDEQSLGETVRWLTGDMVESLRPLAPEVLPPVINGLAELIAPDGELSGEMKEACDRFRNIFREREVRA